MRKKACAFRRGLHPGWCGPGPRPALVAATAAGAPAGGAQSPDGAGPCVSGRGRMSRFIAHAG